MSGENTIAKQYEQAANFRETILERVRDASVMTVNSVLPPVNDTDASEWDRAYQSLGAMGVENLVGRLLMALFPPGTPWFRFMVAPATAADPTVDPAELNDLEAFLYARELQVQSRLDATDYRAQYRTQLEHLIVAGNTLGLMQDDYEVRPYRMDQWVQFRDAAGRILWIITCEVVDAETMDPKDLQKAGLSEASLKQSLTNPYDGKTDLRPKMYTRAMRQRNGSWKIEQELNDKIINTSFEPVTPFLQAGYIESVSEHWSRSFVDRRMGDLRSLNGLTHAVNDLTAAAARCVPVVDPTKGWQPRDLTRANGQVIVGRVDGNVPNGLGFLQSNKSQDIQAAMAQIQAIENRLGRSMLLETASQPTGERVTATQVMRIARELDGALGGPFAKIAKEMQRPLLDRTVYQMERDRILAPIPDFLKEHVEVRILTGLEALSRQMDLDKLIAAVQMLSQLPGALERLNMDVVADRILRYMAVNTDGIIKTPEQMRAEVEAQAQQQLRAEAQSQAVQTLGAVVEERAKQQPTEQRVA